MENAQRYSENLRISGLQQIRRPFDPLKRVLMQAIIITEQILGLKSPK